MSLVAQKLKRLPGIRETRVRSLGREDPLEKENGTRLQYSCLENPMEGGAWSAWGHKESDTTENFTFTFSHFAVPWVCLCFRYSFPVSF